MAPIPGISLVSVALRLLARSTLDAHGEARADDVTFLVLTSDPLSLPRFLIGHVDCVSCVDGYYGRGPSDGPCSRQDEGLNLMELVGALRGEGDPLV